MSKIGLVTTYRIDNYGTKLQAFAMQVAVENLGFETEIIDYYPAYDMRPYRLFPKLFSKLTKTVLKQRKNDKMCSKELSLWRHKAIDSMDVVLHRSPSIKGYSNLKRKVADYDAFICGSDQIWASSNMITDYFNLNFVNGKKRTIAYAPSFGTSNIPNRMEQKYRHFLNNIEYLSVREKSGVDIIKKISGRDALQVIDPTLLVGKEVWDNLIRNNSKQKKEGKYILCYFLGESESHRKMVERLSLHTGCRIICFPHMKKYILADEQLSGEKIYNASPIDFITLIRNSTYVCTDSFHGTVFSILYHKCFFTFERYLNNTIASTNTRIHSLLSSLALEDRIINNDKDLIYYDNNIKYDDVDNRLQAMRCVSISFLENALKNN